MIMFKRLEGIKLSLVDPQYPSVEKCNRSHREKNKLT